MFSMLFKAVVKIGATAAVVYGAHTAPQEAFDAQNALNVAAAEADGSAYENSYDAVPVAPEFAKLTFGNHSTAAK